MIGRYARAGITLGALIALGGCSSSQNSANMKHSQQAASADTHAGNPRLTSFSQEITSPVHEIEVESEATKIIPITVKNTGTQSWFGRGDSGWVDASYRWLDSKGTVLPIEGKRTLLDVPELRPGQTEDLKLAVVGPPVPGSYKLWVSMVQESIAWFYGEGAKPLVLQATVD